MMARVGSSGSRTPGKHALLNSITGRESGVALHLTPASRYIMIDLTAGTGLPDQHSGTSSPEILIKHMRIANTRRAGQSEVVLVEKAGNHAAHLLTRYSEVVGTTIIEGDARSPELIGTIWRGGDCVFINNDPNKITDFALTEELLQRLPHKTTTLSTLGCNASGLKRLPKEDRDGWYDHANLVRDMLRRRRHHDALLVALERDSDQWAYLITGPSKWRAHYERDAREAFKGWEKGVRMVWATDSGRFGQELDRLFRTGQERAEALYAGGLF